MLVYWAPRPRVKNLIGSKAQHPCPRQPNRPPVSKPRSPSSRRWSRKWKAASCRLPNRLRLTSAAPNCLRTARPRSRTRNNRSRCSKRACCSRSRPANPTMPDASFAAWSRERQQRIEGVLERVLPGADAIAARLASAMRYAALGGGKRMRPLLVYAASEVTHAEVAAADACAAAVELIHAYSLIHDDLPCMDDDALRRGKPTCHVAFDVATALLAGDALQSLAFAVLGQDAATSGDDACRLLADAAGYAGMAGGQQLDLDATGAALDADSLAQLHSMKTGALIRAAVQIGRASCRERG